MEWRRFAAKLTGTKLGEPSAQPSVSPELIASENAKRSRANAQVLQELYRVVLVREPSADRGEFGSLVDTLNQGASFEGIYNGFTHSSFYREAELGNPGPPPGASLRVFAEELAALQAELASPTAYDEASARALEVLTPTGSRPAGAAGAPSAGVEVVEFGKGVAAKGAPAGGAGSKAGAKNAKSAKSAKDTAFLVDRYIRLFRGASVFTLKRVLGDEALLVIAEKKADPKALADWYAKWVLRMAGRKVDFGLELRNKADEAFHRQWAMQNSLDRLTWEVLNRLHRVVNEASRAK